jgi:hypothetical protein
MSTTDPILGLPPRHSKTLALIERLRKWTHAVDAQPASDLMDEAAAELERALVVIDSYSHAAAAACREIKQLTDAVASTKRNGREFYD